MTMARPSRNNIDIVSENVVCFVTNIHLTDAKLKNTLSDTYEIARKDARKFKIYRYFGVPLSISATLFTSLLTSDFKSFSFVKGSVLEVIAWVVCAICFLVGIVFALICAACKDNDEKDERDEAISKVMSNIMHAGNTSNNE